MRYVLIGPQKRTPEVIKVACTVLNRPKIIRVIRETVSNLIAELIVCLTIESRRCGSRRFDRYTAGLHQAMVSTECVTV